MMVEKSKNIYINSFIYRCCLKLFQGTSEKRLRNKRVYNIDNSNCIGGVIYTGSAQILPTVNMFFSQPDFVDFCVNLEYYLGQKLCFISSDEGYPIAELRGNGDISTIRLNFNHSKSNEEAEEKWNERKERIRRDNLYIILYMLDGLTVEKVKELENVKCNNKVLLTSRHFARDFLVALYKAERAAEVCLVIFGQRCFWRKIFEKKVTLFHSEQGSTRQCGIRDGKQK